MFLLQPQIIFLKSQTKIKENYTQMPLSYVPIFPSTATFALTAWILDVQYGPRERVHTGPLVRRRGTAGLQARVHGSGFEGPRARV